MTEKEGGDSEKKMTKDFLDRWKKIASKYEGPEEAQGAKKAEKGPESPRTPTTEEALDRFLADIGQKEEKPGARAPEEKGPQDLDELLAEFGLEEAERAPARPEEPKPRAKAKPATLAPEPEPSPDDSQRRVLETLRKVGLVGTGPPSAVAPTKKPAPPPAPAAPSPSPARAKPSAPAKEAAPPAAPPPPAEEEEDSLMLELEALLTDEGPAERAGPEKADPGAPRREAFEEEDLIAELEGLLEGENEVEEVHEEEPALALPLVAAPEPAPVAAPAPPKPEPAPVEVEEISAPSPPPAMVVARVPEPPAAIAPPTATLQRPASAPQTTRPGRVNGGRVNGGRVNGGRVNGGRVNGGRVNGGRVNGGRVNGGRVNGGRVNGGRVNGGRVNGGRVNGGRVNGGRVNGGRVNGGRSGFAGMLPPILVQENRRSRMIRLAVASVIGVSLFAGLLSVAPFGGGPRGPAADGDTQDWVASGALFYQDTQDAALPSALDLREYAIRTEGNPPNRLWFEASTSSGLFSRPSGATFPARGDLFTLLIDVDGSSATGYAYHDLGVDRIVEVSGWDGLVKSTSTKTFGPRPADDFAGFEPVGGLQVAVKEARIEGVLTGIQRVDPGARAAFELRGVDASGVVRSDSTEAPATLRGASLAATVTPVSPGILQPGSTADTPMLSVRLWNPSGAAVEVSSLRVTGRYAPQAPAQAVGAAVWRDTNQNGVAEAGSDTKLTPASSVLPQQTPTTLSFAAVSIAPGGSLTLLVTVDQVPASLAAGSSVVVALDAPSDITVSASAAVSLLRAPVAPGAQPGAYVASPPAAVAVDGITLDWAGRPTAPDPVADVGDAHTDLTQLAANATTAQIAVLVSLSASPMAGAIVPLRLPSTQVLPSTGGGSSAPPVIAPPNLGTDVLFVMIEADNDAGTGYLAGGRGYDYAVRVEGKDHRVVAGGAKILQWQAAPFSKWAELPQVPTVGLGANAIELAAAIPPLSLVARNVSVLAYATDWQGLRDDLAAPLIISNNQGSRGEAVPDTPASRGGLEPVQPPAALVPEFQDFVAPVATVLSLVALARRRRHAPLAE